MLRITRPAPRIAALFSLAVWLVIAAALLPRPVRADPVAPEAAFAVEPGLIDRDTLVLRYQIRDAYYLYGERFRFELAGAPDGVTLGTPLRPPGEWHDDDFFGRVETYRNTLSIQLPVSGLAPGMVVELVETVQGCWDGGICYPPLTRSHTVDVDALLDSTSAAGEVGTPERGGSLLDRLLTSDASVPTVGAGNAASAVTSAAPDRVAAPVGTANAGDASALDESGRISRLLEGASLPLVLVSFFGFGLLLAFTPCTFPMIPILSGIIVGQGHAISRRRAAGLSLVYVLGMAITYALAGVAAGLSGTLLTAALQNVWVLSAFALVFVLLALSMFGFYELQLPTALQSRLAGMQQGGRSRGVAGVAILGVLSALIVGPCVAAPLAGALLYIAKTGDALLGGMALFVMALGMGAPLIAVGLAARSVLPRSGPWMEGVKRAFGVILLGVALWLLAPVLPAAASMLGWALLLILPAVHLHALDPLPPHASGWRRFWKGIGVVMLVIGLAQLVGVLAGGRDPLQPLATLAGERQAEAGAPVFAAVDDNAALDAALAASSRPVMLDFYADWCVSCKEMERFTFTDPTVRAQMAQFTLLKADVTANTDAHKALLARFGLFGPPGILFFAPGGAPIEPLRVVGFMPAEPFSTVLARAIAEAGTTISGMQSGR